MPLNEEGVEERAMASGETASGIVAIWPWRRLHKNWSGHQTMQIPGIVKPSPVLDANAVADKTRSRIARWMFRPRREEGASLAGAFLCAFLDEGGW